MSAIQQMFLPFNNILVRKFLNWKQGDEEDTWRNKALEVLVKKLKRGPDEQYSKLQLVLQQKSEDTPCITLNKSQDGRLQVSHRKMLPHVMYCRIFRWPDLQNQNELRSVPNCLHPAQQNRDRGGRERGRESNMICVNPYHYSRVDHSIYPPVVTPRNTEFASASPPPLSPTEANYLQQPQQSPYHFNNPSALQLTPVPQPAHHQNYQLQSLHQQENPNEPFNYFRNQNQIQNNQQQYSQSYYGGQSPLSESNWYGSPHSTVTQSGEPIINLAESPRVMTQFDSPPPGYTSRDQQPILAIQMETDNESQHTNTTLNGSEESSEHWCRITYAELNQKIGEPFKGSSPKVIVDGYTNPSVHNRRFSLGVLSNINRNSTIEMTRRAIRKGVCLENNGSQIYVENLSDSSIFFHSKNHNVENQLNQHSVVKIEPEGRHKLFDQKVFENLVQECLRVQDGKNYERLFSLTEHCIVKMSFVKGWGSIYQRQDVTSTPCWIEIHLLKPYALIDQYLQQVGPPSYQITSTS